eukprot:3179887-Rhodomonas_salina.1
MPQFFIYSIYFHKDEEAMPQVHLGLIAMPRQHPPKHIERVAPLDPELSCSDASVWGRQGLKSRDLDPLLDDLKDRLRF